MANSIRLGAVSVLVAVVAACGSDGKVDDVDDGAASDTADANDAGDASQPSTIPASTQAALRKAAGCGSQSCQILHAVRVSLPHLGRTDVARAKVLLPSGEIRSVAVDAVGTPVDADTLLVDDRAERVRRYGRLTPELQGWLAAASATDFRWVWIWTHTSPPALRGHEPAASKPTALPEVARLRDDLVKAREGVEIGDSSGPMLRLRVTADELRELAKDSRVALLGTDEYPGKAQGAPWGTLSQWGATIRLPAAHAGMTAPGLGVRVCIKENAKPDINTNLPIVAWANATGTATTSAHARAAAGIVANQLVTSAPWQGVAPKADLYIANFDGFTGAGGVDAWCVSNSVRTLSYSYSVLGGPGGPGGTDMAHDWLAKNSPYTLVVASAGDLDLNNPTSGHIVRNRGFNGLVVGGVYDSNTGDPSDDVWESTSAWGNSTTAHGDYELPHLAAPTEADSMGTHLSGTSAPTAMVAGVGALLSATDSNLDSWPEAKRAVILATATKRANQGTFTSLTYTPGDKKIGVGVLDAAQAVDLASPANAAVPSDTRTKGRLGRTVQLIGGTDWDASGYLVTKWKARAPANGRIRAVIAWDSTTNCSGAGGSCTTDTPDADMDLILMERPVGVWDLNGVQACSSSTYDSTYEVCDIPVTANQEFLIAIKKYGVNSASTYLGVAWYFYQQPSGAPCSAGSECASGSCSGGLCACAADTDCPDRFCGAGACTTKLNLGGACDRTTQCQSGNCVDGVCCDTACAGLCMACSTAKKGSGANGFCGPIANGTNPDTECTPSVSACSLGNYTPPMACNGAGSCSPVGTAGKCDPYACASSTACGTSCVSDANCSGGNWCSAGACVAKKVLAAPCTGSNQCASNQCQSSVCCSASVDDGDACTADSCSSATGLPIHTRIKSVATCAPLWGASPTLAATQLSPTSVRLDWSAAQHDLGVSAYRIYRSDVTPYVGTSASTSWTGTVTAGATYTFRVQAVVTSGPTTTESTDGPSVLVTMSAPAAPLSPPPATTFDLSAPTSFGDQTNFLYTGSSPPQKPLAPYASIVIDPKVQSVVRGHVLDLSGASMGGVTITINGHPEYGYTTTRADGTYDLAVGGGGRVVVRASYGGHIPVQRAVEVGWNEIANVDEFALTPYSPKVTEVTPNAASWQTVRSKTENDCDTTPCNRQATLLIPPGTIVTKVDGTTTAAVTAPLHVRATELTVVRNNLSALTQMPGELPPTTAFTYAIALDADEAIPTGSTIKFSKPIAVYVPNFLGFPIGSASPLGYYDREHAAWVPDESGKVVKIIAIADGKAQLDANNDGIADATDLAILGITDDGELRQLVADGNGDGAPDHAVGDQLWRVKISHFSDWDINQGVAPPAIAKLPPGTKPEKPGCQNKANGSIIHCDKQALGESFPIAGTALALNYWSHRAEGRAANRVAVAQLWEGAPPPGVIRASVAFNVGGRVFVQRFKVADGIPKFAYLTAWDGTDVYGRILEGDQKVLIAVTYSYVAVYASTSTFGYAVTAPDVSVQLIRGGRNPDGSACESHSMAVGGGLAGIKSWTNCPDEIDLTQKSVTYVSSNTTRGVGLGRWDLNVHHSFNPLSGLLYKGDGEVVAAANFDDYRVYTHLPDLVNAEAIATFPDGTIAYKAHAATDGVTFGDTVIIRKPSGSINKLFTTSGYVMYLAVSPDGRLYASIQQTAGHTIELIDTTTGVRTVIAGGASATKTAGTCGDCRAKDYIIRYPRAIDFAADGSIYVVHTPSPTSGSELLQISPPEDPSKGMQDGRAHVYASLSSGTYTAMAAGPDGFPVVAVSGSSTATKLQRLLPGDVAVDIAGTSPTEFSSAGPAPLQKFAAIDLRRMPDGALALATYDAFSDVGSVSVRVRVLTSDGYLRVLAGTGLPGSSITQGPGRATTFGTASTNKIAVLPDRSILISDGLRIARIATGQGQFAPSPGDFSVADGGLLHVFGASGRHKSTYNALTTKKIWDFAYDGANRLQSVTDVAGNTTLIYRSGDTLPSGGTVGPLAILIRAPYGQTTELSLNPDGSLAGIADPSGLSWTMTWNASLPGLLDGITEPRGTHKFTWFTAADDPRFVGMLKKDWLESLGSTVKSQTLSRTVDAITGKISVSVKDATDMSATYETTPGSPEAKTRISKTGVMTTGTSDEAGVTTVSSPNGWTTKTTVSPDPLLGMASPTSTMVTSATTSSGAIERTVTRTSSVAPAGATIATLTSRQNTTTYSGKLGTAVVSGPTETTVLARNTPTTGKTTITRTVGSVGTVMVVENDLLMSAGLATYSPLMDGTDVVVPILNATSYTYSAGRLATITTGSRITSLSYKTTNGLLDVLTDSLLRNWQYTDYDASGRLKTLVMPGARSMSFDFDAAKRVNSVTPPGRPAHAFEYGADDNLDKYKSAGSALAMDYDWDLADRLSKVTRQDGSSLTLNRDVLKRVDNIADSRLGSTDTYTYEPSGAKRLRKIASRVGTATTGLDLEHFYDGPLLAKLVWTDAASGITNDVAYAYDGLVRRSSITVSRSGYEIYTAALRYSSSGWLEKVGASATIDTSPTMTLEHHGPTGLLLGINVGNVADKFAYNAYGELSRHTSKYSTTVLYEEKLEGTAFARDNAGRIVRKDEVVNGVTHRYDYQYNAASGQLEKVFVDGSATATEDYTYGTNGARTGTIRPGVCAGGCTATFNDHDQMLTFGGTSFSYKTSGELEKKTTSSGDTLYAYDARGNLVKVTHPDGTIVDYVVDGFGRRVAKRVGGVLKRSWIYDGHLRIVGEVDASTGAITHFVYGPQVNVPEYAVRGGTTYRVVTDHLGSVRMVVDATTGTAKQRISYDAFGQVQTDEYLAGGWQPLPFGFAGGLLDRDGVERGSGLIHFGAREYDPSIGRWTRPDPIRFAGGEANLYSYVGGDPINTTDPKGLNAAAALPIPAWAIPSVIVTGYVTWWAWELLTRPQSCPMAGTNDDAIEGADDAAEDSDELDCSAIKDKCGEECDEGLPRGPYPYVEPYDWCDIHPEDCCNYPDMSHACGKSKPKPSKPKFSPKDYNGHSVCIRQCVKEKSDGRC